MVAGAVIILVESVIEAICGVIDFLIDRLGNVNRGVEIGYEINEKDQQLIEGSKKIIQQTFPEGIENTLINATIEERVEMITMLMQEVTTYYDIDAKKVCFLSDKEIKRKGVGSSISGYYDLNSCEIVFNLDLLACDKKEVLLDVVDTVFHECRHAYQYKSVMEEQFGECDLEKLKVWVKNFITPISPRHNLTGYFNQVTEYDARNFAALVVGGMK